MQLFLSEYGKIVIAVVAAVLIISILMSGFLLGWKEVGGVSDSVKTEFSSNQEKRLPPRLRVEDFSVKKGDSKNFLQHVRAVDYDQKDISSLIQVANCDQEGKRVSGFNGVQNECEGKYWNQEGIYRYEIRVKSPVTGKVSKGKMIVLVDVGG